MIDPVRPIAIEDIEAARERITGTVLRTPLVKFDDGIYLKLENLQPTNA
jgi:threonine dehydratase